MRTAILSLVVLVVPAIGSAHHSRAEFADDVQAIEGEIVSFQWGNPHPTIELKASGGGDTLHFHAFGSAFEAGRAGITGELFNVGDNVTIVGRRSVLRPNYILATNVLLPDGREVLLTRTVEPYWSGESVGGLDAFIENTPPLADAVAENRGFFRQWFPLIGRNVEDDLRYLPLTPGAAATKGEFDPADNWNVRGEVPGMPLPMLTHLGFAFIDNGATITLRSPYHDIVRTIYIDEAATPNDPAPSKLGHSTGRVEGNTLVVETTGITWTHFDLDGTPQSSNVEIVERFVLSEDQGRLDFHMVVTDAETFTEPATVDRFWVAYEMPN